MPGKAAFLSLCLLMASDSQLFAAKAMKIVYHHATAIAESQTLNGETIDGQRVTDNQALDIRGAKKIAVWIDDPNPVLFTYKWEEPTYAQNADYAAALGFARAIQPIQGLMGKPSGPEAGPVEHDFNVAVAELQRLVKSMPEIARLTNSSPAEAKRRVNAWALPVIEEVIGDFYDQLHAGDLAAFRVAEGVGNVAASGFTEGANLPSHPSTSSGSGIPPTTSPPASPAPVPRPAPAPVADANAVTSSVLRALAQEESIKTMLAAAKKFVRDVGAVGVPVVLGELLYDPARNATANIFIVSVPEFQAIAQESGRATGKVSIPTQPYWPVHLGFAPAFVYSFVEASEFTTEATADGKFQIVERESEYRGTNVSAMLTITPRGWDEPTFGGGLQVGISPVKDQIGLFAGGFFRLTQILSLGLGYGYQQVPELKKGLRLDTPLSAPGDLKTEPNFEGGWYVGINLSLPK